MLGSWWMVLATGTEVLRLPADWVAAEASPVVVPTAEGPVDLRTLTVGSGPRSVTVEAPDEAPFTITLVRS